MLPMAYYHFYTARLGTAISLSATRRPFEVEAPRMHELACASTLSEHCSMGSKWQVA